MGWTDEQINILATQKYNIMPQAKVEAYKYSNIISRPCLPALH